MKFFIAGKEIHSDKKYQAGSLQDYTELGFECVYSHLLAKRYINNGILDVTKDVVVTCEGREFFYDNYIKTIPWSLYQNFSYKQQITHSINASDFLVEGILLETPFFHENYMENSKTFSEMYDEKLTHEQNHHIYVNTGTPKYRYFEEDYDIVTNLNFNKDLIIPNKKYICFNRRYRKHREEFNMTESYAKKLMETLKQTFDVDIYITGYHNEIFNQIENVTWVNLRDWCTLINHDNCMAIVQNQTGTSNLSQICGKKGLLNIAINNDETLFTNPLYRNGRRPDALGKATNFKKLKNIVLRGAEPSIEDIKNTIHKYI